MIDASIAQEGWNVIDNFDDGNSSGWERGHFNPSLPWGPPIFDLSDGSYRFRTTGLVPVENSAYMNSWLPGSMEDGFYRFKLQINSPRTEAGLLLRRPFGAWGGYYLYSESGTGFVSALFDCEQAFRCNALGGNPFTDPQNLGDTYWIEGGVVGNRISMKRWRDGEPEPDVPQIVAYDDSFLTGRLNFVAGIYNFGQIGGPAALDVVFDDLEHLPASACVTPAFSVSETSFTAPFQVDFDIDDPIETEQTGAVRYVWEFGDGASAEGEVVSHTYTSPGIFKVTVWAETEAGCELESQQTITAACPESEIPAPWQFVSMGSAPIEGRAEIELRNGAPDRFSFCTTNAGIGSRTDRVDFAYREFEGDFDATLSLDIPERGAQLGIMARESVERNARMAATYASTSLSARRYFTTRGETDARIERESENVANNTLELRLSRRGSTLVAHDLSASIDGSPVEIGRLEFPAALPETLLVGFFAAKRTPAASDARPMQVSVEGDLKASDQKPRFERGDVNGDTEHDVTDALLILDYLFLGTFEAPCQKALDVDDTGSLDVTDPIVLLRHQFLGAAAPPAPFGACGEDLTPDHLTCETFGHCDGT